MNKEKPTTFRLTTEAKQQLKNLASEQGVSMAAMLEILIRAETIRQQAWANKLTAQAAELARQARREE